MRHGDVVLEQERQAARAQFKKRGTLDRVVTGAPRGVDQRIEDADGPCERGSRSCELLDY